MPYTNGRPTADELEAVALRAIERAREYSGATADREALLAGALASLAIAAQVERLLDALPGAGRGT